MPKTGTRSAAMFASAVLVLLTSASAGADVPACGSLGGKCQPFFKCKYKFGVCKTSCGGVKREECTGGFAKPMFDECKCEPSEAYAAAETALYPFDGADELWVKWVVFAVTVVSVVGVLVAARIGTDADDAKAVLYPLGVASFYNLGGFFATIISLSLSEKGSVGDTFTHGMFTFVMWLLVLFTVGAILACLIGRVEGLMALPLAYCIMTGYFTTGFCVLAIALAFLLFAGIMKLMGMIINLTSGGQPADDEDDTTLRWQCSSAPLRTVFAKITRSLLSFIFQLVNFIFQTFLIASALGGIEAASLGSALEAGTAPFQKRLVDTMHRQFSFEGVQIPDWADIPLDALQRASNSFVDIFATAEEASEAVSRFMLQYTYIWTANPDAAYLSVGAFELFLLLAVFGIVLSDVLLGLAPRDGNFFVEKLVELVSRMFLYTLQMFALTSTTLILALYHNNIDRTHEHQSEEDNILYELSAKIASPLTKVYVVMFLVIAAGFLARLWSGEYYGRATLAMQLMLGKDEGSSAEGTSRSGAFIPAFFGVWIKPSLHAFSIDDRARTWCLSQEDVRLASVNALSYPLYVVPYGCVVAKLGEYMNQSPAYVAGRKRNAFQAFIALTFLAEYVIMLLLATELVAEAEPGEISEDLQADAEDGDTKAWKAVLYITILAVGRFVATLLYKLFLACRERQVHNSNGDSAVEGGSSDDPDPEDSQSLKEKGHTGSDTGSDPEKGLSNSSGTGSENSRA